MTNGHRLFAAAWDHASSREGPKLRDLRSFAAGSVSGHVLEIGVGTGANWPYLPQDITYIGVEPDPHMRRRAAVHAQEMTRLFEVLEAPAEALPFADATFDSGLVTLTLCSVAAPSKALAEINRVLKPGATLHFVEHIRPPGVLGALSSIITPLWSRMFGGCHPNRTTVASLRDSGFVIEDEQRRRLAGLLTIAGIARKT